MALAMYVNGVGRAMDTNTLSPPSTNTTTTTTTTTSGRTATCPTGTYWHQIEQKCVPGLPTMQPKTTSAAPAPAPTERYLTTLPQPTPPAPPSPGLAPPTTGNGNGTHRPVPSNGVTTVVPQNGAETPVPSIPATYTPAQYDAAKPPIGKYVAAGGILAALGFGAFLIARRRRE